MNIKEQAQRLSNLYAELAEKGTWFEYLQTETTNKWIQTDGSPNKGNDLTRWRIAKPKKNIIDLSVCIESGVDMEFKHSTSLYWTVHKLEQIIDGNYFYNHGSTFKCRVRENHWHHCPGGSDCPLPEGLSILIQELSDEVIKQRSVAGYEMMDWENVVGFKVLGPAVGWKYGWEE